MLQSYPTAGIQIFSALGGTKGKLIEHLLGSGGVLGQEVDLWGAATFRTSQKTGVRMAGTQRRERMPKSLEMF